MTFRAHYDDTTDQSNEAKPSTKVKNRHGYIVITHVKTISHRPVTMVQHLENNWSLVSSV